mmetsp:Transcript_30181/g.50793  ORF Transcript_30181/g.50793 Transcript_30181/m.50793 type:complete len:211 (-) Transcript_30181:720-1352(-)
MDLTLGPVYERPRERVDPPQACGSIETDSSSSSSSSSYVCLERRLALGRMLVDDGWGGRALASWLFVGTCADGGTGLSSVGSSKGLVRTSAAAECFHAVMVFSFSSGLATSSGTNADLVTCKGPGNTFLRSCSCEAVSEAVSEEELRALRALPVSSKFTSNMASEPASDPLYALCTSAAGVECLERADMSMDDVLFGGGGIELTGREREV